MTALKPDSSPALVAAPIHSFSPGHPQPQSNSPPLPQPTDDDIEAVIQAATANRGSPTNPPRDTRTQLFVGNLPYRVRWQDLKDLFRKAGTVLRADVSLGPDNRSRGYGTVLLSSAEDAGRAIDMFNGYNWQTRILEVRPDRLPPDVELSLGVVPPSLAAVSAVPSPIGQYGPMPGMFLDERSTSSSRIAPSTATNRTLFVGNLPFHCQWQDLKDLFRQAGTILRADVALGQDGRSRGFGMVSYASDQDADRAVKMFNGYEYNGRPLKVHHDKYSHLYSTATAPSSPLPGYYSPYAPASQQVMNGYPFEHLAAYGQPASPFGTHPPPLSNHPSYLGHQPTVHSQLAMEMTVPDSVLSPRSQTSSQLGPASPKSPTVQARPGSIALPPPPPPGMMMMQPPHGYSPYAHPMGTPLGHPMHHQMVMTPHGLLPMTPSMPSFSMTHSFAPPPPPVNLATKPSSQETTPEEKSTSSSQTETNGYAPPGLTPGHPNQTLMSPNPMSAIHHYGYNMGMLSPGLPFSPGVIMTPGAFWGSPARGGNPYINPAVGAPVHLPQQSNAPQPGSGPAGSTSTAPSTEDAGYFPPVEGGYFPPMTLAPNTSATGGSGSSAGRSARGSSDTHGSTSRTSSGFESATTGISKASPTAVDGLLGRLGKMHVSGSGESVPQLPTLTFNKSWSGALNRPSGMTRGDSDPTPAPPVHPVRHVSADALGNGAGVAVTSHVTSGVNSVGRTPPGSLNLAGLGLRV